MLVQNFVNHRFISIESNIVTLNVVPSIFLWMITMGSMPGKSIFIGNVFFLVYTNLDVESSHLDQQAFDAIHQYILIINELEWFWLNGFGHPLFIDSIINNGQQTICQGKRCCSSHCWPKYHKVIAFWFFTGFSAPPFNFLGALIFFFMLMTSKYFFLRSSVRPNMLFSKMHSNVFSTRDRFFTRD